MNIRKYKCQKCGQEAGVRIIYGYPGPDLCKASKRGEVELGGCCVGDNDPSFHCKTCGHEWGFKRSRGTDKKTTGI